MVKDTDKQRIITLRKSEGLLRRFMLAMLVLSICLVLLWVVFYILTIGVIRRNMRLQAQTVSEEIIVSVEEELLTLEEAALRLSRDSGIAQMMKAEDTLAFYDLGGTLSDLGTGIRSADHIVLFRDDGLPYRLKGNVSNTTLGRIFWLMENGAGQIVTVSSNDTTYVGISAKVSAGGETTGYVVLLQEQERLERLLGVWQDLDYLSAALCTENRLLCANRDIVFEDLDIICKEALFYREKEIGLSGFRLIVWCRDSFSAGLSRYFRVAMPVTVVLLALVMVFFVRYIRRHMVEPMELEKERSLVRLLKKQIGAHFTVNSLNVVRALVGKGEKEEAEKICDELSVLLRYANAGDEYISLLQEFYVLQQYIGIMQVRYPGRIEARIEEDDAFAEIAIPRMLIQPVVENAIVHGLGGGKGEINITADIREEDNTVTVRVRDNGKGMDEEKLAKLRSALDTADVQDSGTLENVALKNIERRIRLVCGAGYGLEIESSPGEGTEVSIRLPLKKM